MALVYIGIGFYYKDKIKELIESKTLRYDILAGVVSVVLIIFCWFIYKDGKRLYYFDMKPVHYKGLFVAILIPCAFGLVIVRLIYWLNRYKGLNVLQKFLDLCGQATIPIMFLHVPLNNWKAFWGYGLVVYLLVGVGIPLMVTLVFNRFMVMRKLLGLPKL